jgi:hypothetical protein
VTLAGRLRADVERRNIKANRSVRGRGAAFFLFPALLALTPETAPPTYCAEWIRQSSQGYERLTVFTDRTLVWKTSWGGKEEVRRQRLESAELTFYCNYFGGPEVWNLKEDLRTGLTGEFSVQSVLTLTRPDGSRKQVRFDDLSPLPPEAAALRSALEGLKLAMIAPLAPASRFTPGHLQPGTLLKRFDGAVFRVRQVIEEKGLVELEGVREPYAEFRKIDELRFQFAPPE